MSWPDKKENCRVCGNEFIKVNFKQFLCGQSKCRRIYQKQYQLAAYVHKRHGQGKCEICSEVFDKRIANQKLCGKFECKQERMRQISRKSLEKKKQWSKKRHRQKSQKKYTTRLDVLLSLTPAQMSMEDHWVKGYYLRHKKAGMKDQEAYEQALKDLKTQKAHRRHSDTPITFIRLMHS